MRMAIDPPRELDVERLRLLHEIGQEFFSSLDFDELLPKVFNTVLSALGAQGGSIWIAEGDVLRCRLAAGSASQRLVGQEVPVGTGFVGDVARKQRSTIVTDAMHDPRFEQRIDRSSTMITTGVLAAPMIARGETVGSIQVTNKVTGDGIFDEADRAFLEGLSSTAAIALRNAQLHTAEKRARDLALLLEISREITSTLDLDHILHAVVNLATRAIPFETGAVGLAEDGGCVIRAIAGEDEVDADTARTRGLAARGAWLMERGAAFYLPDRLAPDDDDERAFVNAFGGDLETADVRSVLYLPLADEQGMLGALLFEASRPDFAGETHRELAAVLANQTAVALRNAELYSQVPLADVLGALAERKRRLFALPRRRLQAIALGAALLLAAVTLIRWPLRVGGVEPAFRAGGYAEVRPMVAGVVDRMHVREGDVVRRGDPLFQLRTAELRGERERVAGALAVAERTAAAAAARGDAAAERMQRARAGGLASELAVIDQEIAAGVVRAPAGGVVLTPRPEELVGARPDAGDRVLVLGRTDTLELELGVRQRDIERVRVGQEVRLRVDALPQRTFRGWVRSIAALPVEDPGGEVVFPVRAEVPNPDGVLRPGMGAHAKVLTDPASVAGRLLRAPVRGLRMLWWRWTP